MFESFLNAGGKRITGFMEEINYMDHYYLLVKTSESPRNLDAVKIVYAAEPFACRIEKMLDVDLPIYNTYNKTLVHEQG